MMLVIGSWLEEGETVSVAVGVAEPGSLEGSAEPSLDVSVAVPESEEDGLSEPVSVGVSEVALSVEEGPPMPLVMGPRMLERMSVVDEDEDGSGSGSEVVLVCSSEVTLTGPSLDDEGESLGDDDSSLEDADDVEDDEDSEGDSEEEVSVEVGVGARMLLRMPVRPPLSSLLVVEGTSEVEVRECVRVRVRERV